MKQTLKKLREKYSLTIIFEDLNTALTIINRKTRERISVRK